MEDNFDIREILYGMRRRWALMLAIIVTVSTAAVAVAFMLPAVYQSSARILVESQQIPDALARSTITSDAAERLQLIEQRLMTRQNLIDLVERLNLFADQPDLTPGEKVAQLRSSTSIRSIDGPAARRRGVDLSAFVITVRSGSPQTAALVANEFVTMVLEQNIRSRSERASETHDFFRREVERLSVELSALEVRISDFKRANTIALPDSLNHRLGELVTLQENQFDLERKIVTLGEEKRGIEAVLESGIDVATGPVLTPAERELQALRSTLAQRRAIYADTHPQVRSLIAQIGALEATVDGQVATDAQDTATPVDRRTGELRRQVDLIDSQLKILEAQRESALRRQAELQQSIELTPRVEMELNSLTRNYDQLQQEFQIAVRKQSEAATGERLEVNRQAERFEVIEQAQVPERPVAPRRNMIAAGGVGGSVLLAIGLVVLLELVNQSIRSPADLERRLNLRPIVAVPYIETRHEMSRRRWILRSLALAALIIVPLALYLVDTHYMPLPVVFEKLMGRFGLDAIIERVIRRFS